MEDVFERVVDFCHKQLLKNDKTMTYLIEKRKINLESINKFEIGLFPKNFQNLFEVVKPKELRDASIIKNASFSTFKTQRLIMPIRDVYGKAIAIAGRTLMPEKERQEKGIPKYKNSIYKKSQHLFGLNFAKYDILKKDVVYVVEGQFDVIMPHQKGMRNVVATCGAFLSVRHLVLLARYTNNIVLLMDNEFEAQEKAKNVVEKRKYEGITITAKNPLKKEKDIDEFLRKYSAQDLLHRLNEGNYSYIRPLWD